MSGNAKIGGKRGGKEEDRERKRGGKGGDKEEEGEKLKSKAGLSEIPSQQVPE